jgi:hypothetical protein
VSLPVENGFVHLGGGGSGVIGLDAQRREHVTEKPREKWTLKMLPWKRRAPAQFRYR